MFFRILHFRDRTDKLVAVCSSITAHNQLQRVTVRTSDKLRSATRLLSWQAMYNKKDVKKKDA